MVAVWDNEQKTANVLPDKTKPALPLGEGLYQIQLILGIDGEPRLYTRQFIVGKTADDLTWVLPTPRNEGSQN